MMLQSSNLSLQWSTIAILIAILALLVTAMLGCIACWRTGFRRSIVVLEVLRLGLVASVCFLLLQPEWVEYFRPEDKPTIVILGDATKSMQTRDAVSLLESKRSVNTREDAMQSWMDPDSWESLRERFQVVLQPIREAEAGGTDLFQAIQESREKYPRLSGLVMISDGDWNAGNPPVEAALAMRLAGVPIHVVPVGSESRLPDLELVSMDAPTFGVAGKSLRIPFSIDSSLPRDTVVSAELSASDGTSLRQDVKVSAMGRTSEAFEWKPEKMGDYVLTLKIPRHADEIIEDNNQRVSPIAIREEKLKVLVIETTPRWEYRYLRNALSRDPGVEVNCLLFHTGLSKVGGGNRDYLPAFPESLDQLVQYDVVFLGDVGMEEGQLTDEQCRLLRGLVEQQASGLVFMPGMYGRQSSIIESPLGDLYPVILDPKQPEGWGSRNPSTLELSELGVRSLLTKLANTQDENIDVWNHLPGFQWYAPVVKARPGSDVLAVHHDASNEFGRIPLLVTRTFGAGKVLFMGTDGAWRWRKGVEDLYHYRFWGQVVRWMAYQRNMAKGESMRLYFTPEQPQVRQTITLNSNVMETSGEPLTNGEVSVTIRAPSGATETIRLESLGSDWGAYSGRFEPKEPGSHSLMLHCQETGASLEASVFVQGGELERIGKPSRPEVLIELANVSRGMILELNQRDKVKEAFASLPEPTVETRRLQLWSNPYLAFGLVVLLGVFWVGRKAVGLI